jgi:hypothetical protein
MFFGVCFSTTARAQTNASSPVQANAQARLKYDDLRKDILNLRQEVDTLKAKVAFDEILLNTKQGKSDSISLDLTQKAYQRLDTDNGFFLVSVEEAVPYLNGYKIHLSIGNPSYATYSNYKLKVRWSKAYDWGNYSQTSYDDWNKGIQEKEIAFPDSLLAGTWNSVDLVLAPVSPDQLGYLALSMNTSTVSLHAR